MAGCVDTASRRPRLTLCWRNRYRTRRTPTASALLLCRCVRVYPRHVVSRMLPPSTATSLAAASSIDEYDRPRAGEYRGPGAPNPELNQLVNRKIATVAGTA